MTDSSEVVEVALAEPRPPEVQEAKATPMAEAAATETRTTDSFLADLVMLIGGLLRWARWSAI